MRRFRWHAARCLEYAGWAPDKAAWHLVVLTLEEDEVVLFQARLNDVRMFMWGVCVSGRWRTGVREERLFFGYEQPASMFVRQAASG